MATNPLLQRADGDITAKTPSADLVHRGGEGDQRYTTPAITTHGTATGTAALDIDTLIVKVNELTTAMNKIVTGL
jgi:hypothetical protein